MTKDEKIKRLYVLLLLNNASIKLAKSNNKPKAVHKCTNLGLYIEALFLRIKDDRPITKQGNQLIYDAPMLLKDSHITPGRVKDAKRKGLFNL